MRLPLVPAPSNRIDRDDKDAVFKNSVVVSDERGTVSLRRPACQKKVGYPAAGKGLASFNGDLLSVYGNTLYDQTDPDQTTWVSDPVGLGDDLVTVSGVSSSGAVLVTTSRNTDGSRSSYVWADGGVAYTASYDGATAEGTLMTRCAGTDAATAAAAGTYVPNFGAGQWFLFLWTQEFGDILVGGGTPFALPSSTVAGITERYTTAVGDGYGLWTALLYQAAYFEVNASTGAYNLTLIDPLVLNTDLVLQAGTPSKLACTGIHHPQGGLAVGFHYNILTNTYLLIERPDGAAAVTPQSITDDGLTVVGVYQEDLSSSTRSLPFRWTVSGGWEDLYWEAEGLTYPTIEILTDLGQGIDHDLTETTTAKVSGDGSLIAYSFYNINAEGEEVAYWAGYVWADTTDVTFLIENPSAQVTVVNSTASVIGGEAQAGDITQPQRTSVLFGPPVRSYGTTLSGDFFDFAQSTL